MLHISDLNCSVGKNTLLTVDQLSLESGQFCAIAGPNGAGKSTLLKAISSDITYRGHIRFHHRDLQHWSALEKARHIGVLPQSSAPGFPFKAGEVVALGLTPLSMTRQDARQQVRLQMQRTDCLHLSDTLYPRLSGGEKQRIQLARVLLQLSQASETPLLLLDEPTSAQDLGQQHTLLALTRALCREQGYGTLAILHDLNQILGYCDHCCVLHEGAMQLKGPPASCLTADRIRQYWGYDAEVLQRKRVAGVAVV